jgi:hypothetical protein
MVYLPNIGGTLKIAAEKGGLYVVYIGAFVVSHIYYS